MRVRAALLFLAIPLVVCASAVAQPRDCPGGVEFEPDGTFRCLEAPPSGGDAAWWATEEAQAIVGGIALAGSLVGGPWAILRVRAKRRAVGDFLARIERIFLKAKAAPMEALDELVAVRADAHELHRRGRIDDAPFLQIEERLRSRLTKLRIQLLAAAIPDLPDRLLTRVQHAIEDGTVSTEDVRTLSAFAKDLQVAHDRRSLLSDLLAAWATQDAAVLAEADA